jgi:hypothetical protein
MICSSTILHYCVSFQICVYSLGTRTWLAGFTRAGMLDYDGVTEFHFPPWTGKNNWVLVFAWLDMTMPHAFDCSFLAVTDLTWPTVPSTISSICRVYISLEKLTVP